MLSSLLEAVDVNVRNGRASMRMFEIGRVFAKSEDQPFTEKVMCGIAVTGSAAERSWNGEKRMADFYDIKGIIEGILHALYLDKDAFFYYDRTSTLSDQVLTLEVKGRYAGQAVEVSQSILAEFDIDQPVYYAELELAVLEDTKPERQMYHSVPKYPSVSRDLAILVGKEVRARQIQDAVLSANSDHLREIRIVDVFSHESLGPDKKSVAFSMTFQAPDHTLTEEEISGAMKAIVDSVRTAIGAELRA
jgi:phenylalanyl-tRNA synthetase beta chain